MGASAGDVAGAGAGAGDNSLGCILWITDPTAHAGGDEVGSGDKGSTGGNAQSSRADLRDKEGGRGTGCVGEWILNENVPGLRGNSYTA